RRVRRGGLRARFRGSPDGVGRRRGHRLRGVDLGRLAHLRRSHVDHGRQRHPDRVRRGREGSSRLTLPGSVGTDEGGGMAEELKVGPASELPPGKVTGVGRYAVGNAGGTYFAVTRRCRHLYADLTAGRIDREGCLVCPWHGSKYDVSTGR